MFLSFGLSGTFYFVVNSGFLRANDSKRIQCELFFYVSILTKEAHIRKRGGITSVYKGLGGFSGLVILLLFKV